jgi:hypothetical protein
VAGLGGAADRVTAGVDKLKLKWPGNRPAIFFDVDLSEPGSKIEFRQLCRIVG